MFILMHIFFYKNIFINLAYLYKHFIIFFKETYLNISRNIHIPKELKESNIKNSKAINKHILLKISINIAKS